MPVLHYVESHLDPAKAAYRAVVPAGEPWFQEVLKGQHFRIVDLHGNQAAVARPVRTACAAW